MNGELHMSPSIDQIQFVIWNMVVRFHIFYYNYFFSLYVIFKLNFILYSIHVFFSTDNQSYNIKANKMFNDGSLLFIENGVKTILRKFPIFLPFQEKVSS